MASTSYTRATLPQAYFPDNYNQVSSRQRQLEDCKTTIFEYAVVAGGSAFVGFITCCFITLITVAISISHVKLIMIISIPILTFVPGLISPVILRCYYQKKAKKIEILIRKDNLKLTIPEIRNIYLQEGNQPILVDDLIGNQLELR